MKNLLLVVSLSILSMNIMGAGSFTGNVKVRVKDVARLAGYEEYSLTGYGVVVGLNATGDSDAPLTQRALANALMKTSNIKVNEADLKVGNTASVFITLIVNKTAHKGDMIQATVSTAGDAKSLTGGTLLLSPIKGEDGETWAIAQGPITTGGYSFGSDKEGEGGNTVVKNHPTVGILANGAKLIKDINADSVIGESITYYLDQPDFTTVNNLIKVVNKKFIASSVAPNSSSVEIRIPKEYIEENRITEFISEVEQLEFETDREAKIVFNEKTGTIIVGGNVKISSVAIAHGNVTVNIQKLSEQVGIAPFEGDAKMAEQKNVTTDIDEAAAKLFPIPNTTTVNDLVNVLNALEVSPRDMMLIFIALKKSGALHAKIESM